MKKIILVTTMLLSSSAFYLHGGKFTKELLGAIEKKDIEKIKDLQRENQNESLHKLVQVDGEEDTLFSLAIGRLNYPGYPSDVGKEIDTILQSWIKIEDEKTLERVCKLKDRDVKYLTLVQIILDKTDISPEKKRAQVDSLIQKYPRLSSLIKERFWKILDFKTGTIESRQVCRLKRKEVLGILKSIKVKKQAPLVESHESQVNFAPPQDLHKMSFDFLNNPSSEALQPNRQELLQLTQKQS